MGFFLTMAAAAGAAGIELLEALAIVMAVAVARRLSDALLGAGAAAVAVTALCVVVGPGLLGGADARLLRGVIGALLLVFGVQWLRKGVLRMAGRRRRRSSFREFEEERQELAGQGRAAGPDWAARAVAFKGVFLEGLEVGLIVLALGGAPGKLVPALLGAAVALVLVIAMGVVLHAPLRRVPETQLKLGVGIALTSFGTFFMGEGLGVHWPLGEVALLYLAALYGATAWAATAHLSRPRAAV